MLPRTLGFDASELDKNVIDEWDFLKMEGPGAIGTHRLTNRPGGYTGNIDGSTQTWEEAGLTVAALSTEIEEINSVSWFSIADLDGVYRGLANAAGFRGKTTVTLYNVLFDATNVNSLVGAAPYYTGVIDDGGDPEGSGVLKFTLKSHFTPWGTVWPHHKIGSTCINQYRSSRNCQYEGAEPVGEVTCDFSFGACERRGNTLNFNGFLFLPKPTEELKIGA